MDDSHDSTILLLLFVPLVLIFILLINIYVYIYINRTTCCKQHNTTKTKIKKYIKKNKIVKKHGNIFEYEKNMNINVECSICYKQKYTFLFYNNYSRFIVTNCDHIICCSCAKIWININPSCPVCRADAILVGFNNIV